jgi:lipopolysaccharide transport system ATP-binding protein
VSDTVIQVENLSKKYIIGHQQEGRYRYTTLRDSLTGGVKSIRAKFLNPARRSTPNPAGEEFWALNDVSFEIKQGDRVGFIGRNGAGKSTLLKILSRITEPTTGRISIQGRVASLLEVGTGFHPELTGRENIYLNGAILGMSRVEIKRKFDEIVYFAEVEKFLDTPVKRYSSGMYVRLAFAVAAHLEPEILIVDEVLAVGDAQFQKKCLTKMESVAQEGRTILFVSHNMGAVRGICNIGIWLKNGEVFLTGSSHFVADKYLQNTFEATDLIINLRTIKRNHGLGNAFCLTDLEINGGNPVFHGEPLVIRFGYKSLTNVHDVSVGIGFNSLEGTRLMTLDSDHPIKKKSLEVRKNVLSKTAGSLTMKIDDVPLQPGRYVIDVGARSGDYSTLDALSSCTKIDVLPGPNTPSHLVRQNADGGVRISTNCRWNNQGFPN